MEIDSLIPRWAEMLRDGVTFAVHIEYWRGKTKLKPEDLGIPADMASELKKTSYLGYKMLMPETFLRTLASVDTKARVAITRNSFQTGWGQFVGLTTFDDVNELLDQYEAEFYAIRDQIVNTYDQWVQDITEIYRQQGRLVYEQVLVKNRDNWETLPDRNTWVTNYVSRILSHIPDKNYIYRSFNFQVTRNYILLPDQIAQAQLQAEGYETVARGEAEKAAIRQRMFRQVSEEALKQKEELVKGFFADVKGQLTRMILEVAEDVKDAIYDKGYVHPRTVVQVTNLIDQVYKLNFWEDEDTSEMLAKLRATILDKSPDKRDIPEIDDTLASIISASRQTLLNLERLRPPQRELDLQSEDSLDLNRGRRVRNLELDLAEPPATNGRRRRKEIALNQ